MTSDTLRMYFCNGRPANRFRAWKNAIHDKPIILQKDELQIEQFRIWAAAQMTKATRSSYVDHIAVYRGNQEVFVVRCAAQNAIRGEGVACSEVLLSRVPFDRNPANATQRDVTA